MWIGAIQHALYASLRIELINSELEYENTSSSAGLTLLHGMDMAERATPMLRPHLLLRRSVPAARHHPCALASSLATY